MTLAAYLASRISGSKLHAGVGGAPSGPQLAPMSARHSQWAVNRAGINIQPTFANEYQQYPRVKELLAGLNVALVRGQFPASNAAARTYYQELHSDLGIKAHFTMGTFTYDDATNSATRTSISTHLTTAMLALTHSWGSWNEPNGHRAVSGNPTGEVFPDLWPGICTTHQQWLWNKRTELGDAADHIVIAGPSLHSAPQAIAPRTSSTAQLEWDYQQLAPCAPYMDATNMHSYPGGQEPANGIDDRTAWAEAGVGVKPVICTETGYNNGVHTSWSARTPWSVVGVYADRLLMEHLWRNNTFFWFELLNNAPPDSTDEQNFFGIVEVPSADPTTWTPMPAYTTLSRFLGRMKDTGAAFSPPALPVKVTGPADLYYKLFGKRDGSYQLVMWRRVSNYRKSDQTILSPAASTVTVEFEKARTASQFRPSGTGSGTTPVTAATHTVQVDGRLVVLDITPDTTTPPDDPDDTIPPTGLTIGQPTEQVRMAADSGITENSGMMDSRNTAGWLYVMTDGGGETLKTINKSTGAVGGTITITGSNLIDKEDMTPGTVGNGVWIADTGNNSFSRTNQKLVRFFEPSTIGNHSLAGQDYPISYSDDPTGANRNCEALLSDPDGRLWLATKGGEGSVARRGLYRGPNSMTKDGNNLFTRVADVAANVTGGAWHPTLNFFVLMSGANPDFIASVYDGSTYQLLDQVTPDMNVAAGQLGVFEALCFSAGGSRIYAGIDSGAQANQRTSIFWLPVTPT